MPKILIITDEKKSSINQVEALSNEIQNQVKKKIIIIRKIIARKKFHFFPNSLIYLCLKTLSFFNKKYFSNQKVDLIISCGRIAAPYNLIFKKINSCKNIHIQNPYFNFNLFTKIIMPEHDKFNRENVVNILGTLVNRENLSIDRKSLKKIEKKIGLTKKKIICFLVGGSGKSSEIKFSDVSSIINSLNNLGSNYDVIYLFSRRTHPNLKKFIIQKKKTAHSHYPQLQLNPYWYFVLKSDFFFVTEDSVSMTSEVLSTNKPVFIVPINKLKKKIRFFQKNLLVKGYTKKFEGKLFKWKYKEFNETKRIVFQIKDDLKLFS